MTTKGSPRTGQDTGVQENTRAATNGYSTGPDALLHEILAVHARAEALLRAVDPVACELYQLGYRAGLADGDARAGARAQTAAQQFLDYLSEDPDATPGPIPPLDRGAAA